MRHDRAIVDSVVVHQLRCLGRWQVAADGELVRRWVRGREQVVEEVSHPWATPPFNSADRHLNSITVMVVRIFGHVQWRRALTDRVARPRRRHGL